MATAGSTAGVADATATADGAAAGAAAFAATAGDVDLVVAAGMGAGDAVATAVAGAVAGCAEVDVDVDASAAAGGATGTERGSVSFARAMMNMLLLKIEAAVSGSAIESELRTGELSQIDIDDLLAGLASTAMHTPDGPADAGAPDVDPPALGRLEVVLTATELVLRGADELRGDRWVVGGGDAAVARG